MAAKSFLSSDEIQSLRDEKLVAPVFVPSGERKKGEVFPSIECSKYLSNVLEKKLSKYSNWQEAGPVALGSWARHELSPQSDIDLLFCGPEEVVKKLVDQLNQDGFKLRYRIPENLDDWCEGVLPTDWVALLNSRPFSVHASEQLEEQKKRIVSGGKSLSRQIVRALQQERKDRNFRYDSISNYLEPNLKYGAGGLRDIQQALYLAELYPDRFEQNSHFLEVLHYYRDFFLTVRQKLQLEGGSDILVAQFQPDIADWFGYPNHLEFMREVQKGLSRVSFYSDWVFDRVIQTKSKREQVEFRTISTVHDLFIGLRENPSVLMQYRVRLLQDQIFRSKPPTDRQIGRWLSRYVRPEVSDEFIRALFRSRLIDKCLPNLRKLVGLVQHNQYHRYSAETHVQQTLRTLLRMYRQSGPWKKFKKTISRLDEFDWQVLMWTCIYHDIGKGRKGDHSVVGAKIAEKDLKKMGFSQKLIDEVVWMVKNHLLISASAFRKNPRSRKTWRDLYDKGVVGQRLYRLSLFTVIDIIATNPDAWNSWKEELLLGLIESMEQPEASQLILFLKAVNKKKIKVSAEFIEVLETSVLTSLPMKVLVEEAESLTRSKKSLEPLFVSVGKDEVWVRLHEKNDRPGIFVDYVNRLYALGVSIRQASIHTSKTLGVYDWFMVKSSMTPAQMSKRFSILGENVKPPQTIKFDEIQLVSQDESEAVLSFRGRDRAGALVTAATALKEKNLSVNWASVHTWGRMLDDVFGVSMPENLDEILADLRKELT